MVGDVSGLALPQGLPPIRGPGHQSSWKAFYLWPFFVVLALTDGPNNAARFLKAELKIMGRKKGTYSQKNAQKRFHTWYLIQHRKTCARLEKNNDINAIPGTTEGRAHYRVVQLRTSAIFKKID